MGEQQKEALSIISKIKNDFNQNSPDLKLIFRQALLAYQILGSDMEYNWFYSELNGYPAGSTSPEYRKIEGVFKWHYDSNGFYEGASISSALETYGWPRFIASEVPQKTTIDIYTPIDWILQAASSGYLERTDEVRKIYFGHAQIGEIIFRRYRNFESNSFKNCLREIERNAYDRITHTYVSLKYGNAIQSIWDEYRIAVDRKLSTLGFDGHLKEIEKGITSTNPASWQSAMYACRNLTSNIANYLWRDPRPTYDLLPGQGPNEKLQVTEDKFANRLSAYLHQKD